MSLCFLAFFTPFLGTPQPGANPPLALDQALERAGQKRPEIALYRSQVQASLSKVRQARSGELPSLILQGTATDGPQGAPSFGPLQNSSLLGSAPLSLEGLPGDPLKKQYGAGLTLTQNLLDFGRTQHLIASKSSLVKATREDAMAQMASVFLSVERAYYGALHARQVLLVDRQNLVQREATLKQAQAFFDAKLRSGVDLQTSLTEREAAKAALVSAENDEKYAFANLNSAMGETSLAEYELTTQAKPEADASLPASGEEAMCQASVFRPEVLSAAQQTDAAKQLLKGVQSDLLPRIDAIASVGALRPSSLIPENKNYALGVVLSIPIFTGGYAEGRTDEERAHVGTASAQLIAIREAVRLQAAKAWLDYRSLLAKLDANKSEAQSAQRNLELATERYHLQLSSIVELNQAEALSIRAQSELAEAEYDVNLARANLKYATGRAYGHYLDAALRSR